MFYFSSSQIDFFGKQVTYYAVLPIIAAVIICAVGCVFAHVKRIDVGRAFRCCLICFMCTAIFQLFNGNIPAFMLPFALALGVVGVTLLFWLVGRRYGEGAQMTQLAVISEAIYSGISKIGCFRSGCCFGRRYDGALSVTYGTGTLCGIKEAPLFPAQLVTSVLLLLSAIIFFIVFLYFKSKYLTLLSESTILFIYYSCVSLCDPAANQMYFGSFDMSKLMALLSLIAMLIFGIMLLVSRNKKSERK